MSEETLWERFTESGKITDYLSYVNVKGNNNADSRRNSSEGAFCRRNG
jgi:hypothetical protein